MKFVSHGICFFFYATQYQRMAKKNQRKGPAYGVVPDCEKKKRRIGVWRRNGSMYVSLMGDVVREKSMGDLACMQDDQYLNNIGGFVSECPVPASGNKSLKDWGLPQSVTNALGRQGIAGLYDWQDECLRSIHSRDVSAVVYSAPTSGGKSLVADITLLRRLIYCGKRALIVCPFVSICRERSNFLRKVLSPCGIVVEEFHGPVGKPWHPGVDIAICTVQKAQSIFHRIVAFEEEKDDEGEGQGIEGIRISDCGKKFSDLIGTIVVDEFHLVADNPNMESFVSRLSLLPDREKVLLVGMTATLPSESEGRICDWLGGLGRCLMFKSDYRPVDLSVFTKRGTTVSSITTQSKREIDVLFDLKIDSDYFASLVAESLSKNISTVVFCATRNWCENAASLLTRLVPFSTDHVIISKRSDTVEALRVLSPCGVHPILSTSIIGGVAFHHAGLTSEERVIIETAFREKTILVLCATSTLSAGVNLPAERVILRTVSAASGGMNVSTCAVSAKMKQMVGRAGRAGHSTKGEAIVMVSSGKEEELVREAFMSSSKNSNGDKSIKIDPKWIAKEILEIVIFLKKSNVKFFKNNFIHSKFSISSPEIVDKAIEFLVTSKLVALVDYQTVIIPSAIGVALAHSAMPPDEAEQVFSELNMARQKLCLSGNDIHLLFLVTPPVSVSETEFDDFVNSSELMQAREIRAILSDNDSLARKKRMMVALMLRDLTSMEVNIAQIANKYGVQTGTVQYLQANAATYCAMVSSFCERLHWTSLAAALNSIKPKLHFGVPDELLPLVEVEGVSPARARALANAGFSTVQKISKATPLDIASVLARSTCVAVSSQTAQTLLTLTSTMIINNARIKLGRCDLISESSASSDEGEYGEAIFSPVSPPLLHQLIGTQRDDFEPPAEIDEDEIFLGALDVIDAQEIDKTQNQDSQPLVENEGSVRKRRISEMTTVDARDLKRHARARIPPSSHRTGVVENHHQFEDFGFDSFILKAIDFNSF